MPKRTLDLLDLLGSLGFNQDHFRAIHHFREEASIDAHRKYCSKTESSTGKTNKDVRERLEVIYGLLACDRITKREDPRVKNHIVQLAIIEPPL
jgi:hypothetical protein